MRTNSLGVVSEVRYPSKVKIDGDPAAEFERELEVKKLLEAAGVRNVEVVTANGG